MMRREQDSMGYIEVPQEKYWGAQTQRSLCHFDIGNDTMPLEVVKTIALIKKCAAKANNMLGKLTDTKADLIVRAAEKVLDGSFDSHFPLRVWQTGSGTHTNMNVNEVIANCAIELAGGILGSKDPIHPNDDVNMSQSSNDVFSTAMHITTVLALKNHLIPILENMIQEFQNKALEFNDIIKIGRTHLQDAVPITLGQEFSGYTTQLTNALNNIKGSISSLCPLPLGGTAVGTGLNAPRKFAQLVIDKINAHTKELFTEADNKFALIAAHDTFVNISGTLKTLATTLIKIANDIRWLASGPRCGLGELILPSNEPGSSIMPGKVNPSQCEAIIMAATQVIGYDTSITIANSQSNFELNVSKPLIIFNLLSAINLLSSSCRSFTKYAIKDLKANTSNIQHHLNNSLMSITILNEKIGYDKAASIVKLAQKENLFLKEAATQLNYLSEKEFESYVNVKAMTKQ